MVGTRVCHFVFVYSYFIFVLAYCISYFFLYLYIVYLFLLKMLSYTACSVLQTDESQVLYSFCICVFLSLNILSYSMFCVTDRANSYLYFYILFFCICAFLFLNILFYSMFCVTDGWEPSLWWRRYPPLAPKWNSSGGKIRTIFHSYKYTFFNSYKYIW